MIFVTETYIMLANSKPQIHIPLGSCWPNRTRLNRSRSDAEKCISLPKTTYPLAQTIYVRHEYIKQTMRGSPRPPLSLTRCSRSSATRVYSAGAIAFIRRPFGQVFRPIKTTKRIGSIRFIIHIHCERS